MTSALQLSSTDWLCESFLDTEGGGETMGAGAYWRAAGRSTAHRTDRTDRRSRWPRWLRWFRWPRQETCCVGLLVLRMTSSSVYAASVCVLLLLGVYLLLLPEPYPLKPAASGVLLLIWTHPFGQYRRLPDCLKLYQIHGCTLTDDARAYRHADAVIVHHRELVVGSAGLPPEPRPRAQKWIWMNYESPAHTPGLWLAEDVFNVTLSYRRDSDIFLPYGRLVPRGRANTPGLQQLRAPSRSHLLRPGLLAWVISNWAETQTRVVFFNELRRYIHVDVFGRMGQPVPEDGGTGVEVRKVLRRYQFYLSLENSQHTDYITEKLWNAVRAGAIPVVLGPSRQNYERFLPPEAFIHVDDFSSVRGLARYLRMLRRNPALLRRHLDWRGGYSVHQLSFWGDQYCSACKAVKATRGQTQVVRDLTRWFIS